MQFNFYSNKILILILLGISMCRGDQAGDLYQKCINTVCGGDYPQNADLNWLTPEMRQAVILKAQAALNDSNPNNHFGARPVLIELGDAQTINAYMADYHEGKTGVMPSIQLLPYLIDDLYNGSTHRESMAHGSDLSPGPSLMDNSTTVMYEILTIYPSFSTKTKIWAKQKLLEFELSEQGPQSAGNQLMRTWWKHNKDAVLAHRYNEANWLPSPEQEKALQASLKAQNNTPRQFASPSKSPKPAPLAANFPADSEGSIWWRIGIAVILVTSGFFLLRFARTKSP